MRTPEQRASEQALDEAVRACIKAEGHENGALIVEHMTIVCTTAFDAEGNSVSGISFYTPGDIPHYRMLGMLDFVATGLRAQVVAAQCPPQD